MTPAPITATSTEGGTLTASSTAKPPAGALSPGLLPIGPVGILPCIKTSTPAFGWRFSPFGGGRDLQSLRRCEPGQVQRISALPNSAGQRFLSPLSGISLERTSFKVGPGQGSRAAFAQRRIPETWMPRSEHTGRLEDYSSVCYRSASLMVRANAQADQDHNAQRLTQSS
jgi:hypothetical protein